MSAKIAAIEAFHANLPLPRALALGALTVSYRDYVIVRVRDTDGCEGSAYGLARNAPIAMTIRQCVAPTLIGQPLNGYEHAYRLTVRRNTPLGTNGIFWRALSVVDCAIHDLMAVARGIPLHRLLGATERFVPALLVGGYPRDDETDESLREQVRLMASRAPAGIKIGSCGNFARDTRRIEICRDAAPDGPPLMIDLYWQCDDPGMVTPFARQWSRFGLGWIEDPFAFDDVASATALAHAIDYPVAIGDEQTGQRHFERLMRESGLRVLRLDATVCGGIGAFMAIARAAADANIPVSTHLFPELHVHLAAACPAVQWLEDFPREFQLDAIDRVWSSDPWRFHAGRFAPTSRAGIGYDWDEDALRHHRTHFPS